MQDVGDALAVLFDHFKNFNILGAGPAPRKTQNPKNPKTPKPL